MAAHLTDGILTLSRWDPRFARDGGVRGNKDDGCVFMANASGRGLMVDRLRIAQAGPFQWLRQAYLSIRSIITCTRQSRSRSCSFSVDSSLRSQALLPIHSLVNSPCNTFWTRSEQQRLSPACSTYGHSLISASNGASFGQSSIFSSSSVRRCSSVNDLT